MSEVIRHRPWGDAVPIEFVTASDYDQLESENERMSNKMTLVVDESNQHRKERDTLRKQLDEARGLLDQTITQVGRTITSEIREQIDDWLEANKV